MERKKERKSVPKFHNFMLQKKKKCGIVDRDRYVEATYICRNIIFSPIQ